MINLRSITITAFVFATTAWMIHAAGGKLDNQTVVTGDAAFVDYHSQKTGTFRKITVNDLPKPLATPSSTNRAMLVPRPADAWPQAPAGFKVDLYATGLDQPRQIRTAPNGDFFVAESQLGQIKVFRGRDKVGKPEQVSVFASGLKRPFGVNFYPPGANPQWVYVGNTDSVVRFRYQNGDLKAGARRRSHCAAGSIRRRPLDQRRGVLARRQTDVCGGWIRIECRRSGYPPQ